jgi:hypothetical protein
MTESKALYQERSPWPVWAKVVFWSSMMIGVGAVVAAGDGVERAVGLAVLLTLPFLIQWLVAGLRVRLYADEIEVAIGSAGVIKKRIPYDEIERLESVRYRPIREFGGWGMRIRLGKRAWTSRGNQAVVLHMTDGLQVYVGSDNPHRLEERIRAVGGTKIGRKALSGEKA